MKTKHITNSHNTKHIENLRENKINRRENWTKRKKTIKTKQAKKKQVAPKTIRTKQTKLFDRKKVQPKQKNQNENGKKK